MHDSGFNLPAVARLLAFLCASALLAPSVVAGRAASDGGNTDPPRIAQAAPSFEPARWLERIRSVSVAIRRSAFLVGSGPVVGGFAIGRGQIVTSLAALDATDSIEIVWPDGARVDMSGVVALDRRDGWVLLAHTSAGPDPLPRAAAALAAGDRCVVLGRGPSGDEAVARGIVVAGRLPGGSLHCVAEFSGTRPVPGAPILNESGEVAAIAGTWMTQSIGPMHRVLDLDPTRPTGLSTPVIPLPSTSAGVGAVPLSFDALWRTGAVLPPVATGHVLRAGFSRALSREDQPHPIDARDVFARRADATMCVFVNWSPLAQLEGDVVLRVFDEGNGLVGQSTPVKGKLKRGTSIFQGWNLPLPARTGEYRFDVSIGPVVYWRSYAAVVDPEPPADVAGAAAGSQPVGPPVGASSPPRRIGGVISPPQKLLDVRPFYPSAAQERKVQGTVVISATITATGEVIDAKVVKSIPGLDQAALDAVRRWRFSSTLVDGKPEPVIMTMTSSFTLK